ncbi:hypothetical protein [Halarcobacter sp.]|uniref:hypothetical protein n=1 Tax=Halarcobacter sp. TaxID=2321133 RepID=UPI002AAAB949|nr:hypothetical protein [Halarcobacter sp.]
MINKYKKFVIGFVVFLLLTIGFHYFIWTKYTSHVLLVHDNIYTGDLGRMSMYPDSAFPRQSYPSKKSVNLPKEHIDFNTWYKTQEPIDVLTIGDSFSNAATQGTNPFYQDYIATYNNFKVLNINQLPGTINYLETISLLNNNGLLDKMKPKYIIIESVERFSIGRFSVDTDFFKTESIEESINKFKLLINPYLGKDKDIKFINNQNFKAFKNNILYNFDDRAFSSKVYKRALSKDFFTSVDKNSLFFFKDDLDNIYNASDENVNKLNKNFNTLAKILSKKGIKLFFMPAVDKYNLYSKFIIDNPYQNSVFFEKLRVLDKKYILIDTKAILLKELEKGTLDLYYPDDTHWSYKAPNIIFKNLKFRTINE